MRIVISEKAKLDLLQIYRYRAEKTPNAAVAFIRKFDDNFESLARFPFIGRERSNLAPDCAASSSGFISFFM